MTVKRGDRSRGGRRRKNTGKPNSGITGRILPPSSKTTLLSVARERAKSQLSSPAISSKPTIHILRTGDERELVTIRVSASERVKPIRSLNDGLTYELVSATINNDLSVNATYQRFH